MQKGNLVLIVEQQGIIDYYIDSLVEIDEDISLGVSPVTLRRGRGSEGFEEVDFEDSQHAKVIIYHLQVQVNN